MTKLKIGIVACILLANSAYAKTSDLFSYDKSSMDIEFKAINRLEELVFENDELTLREILNSKEASSCLFSPETMDLCVSLSESPLGMSSYLWGCCFNAPGVMAVYLISDNDPAEMRKAWIGFGCSAICLGVSYVSPMFAMFIPMATY